MNWLHVLALTAMFLLGSYYGEWREKKRGKMEFRWDCLKEGCHFHVGSTSADLTLQLADLHTESSHPKEG